MKPTEQDTAISLDDPRVQAILSHLHETVAAATALALMELRLLGVDEPDDAHQVDR